MASDDIDHPPRNSIFPTDDELRRTPLARAPHSEELDGPDDLDLGEDDDATVRARVPTVSWPKADRDAPDYAHLEPEGREPIVGDRRFKFDAEDIRRLIKANAFDPRGPGNNDQGTRGRIVFALRGALLIDDQDGDNDGAVAGVDHLELEETRPDHRDFKCVIGICDTNTGELSAYTASTVPNVKFMTNYYKWNNGLGGNRTISANMLPTGCYVFRVHAHGGGRIRPALRLTDPDSITSDGKATVLRTRNNLTYSTEDIFDYCQPYDNVHCAYAYDSFSSAGCLTIKGPDGAGPWGQFQSILKTMRFDTRIDVLLLTGREASMASYLREKGLAQETAYATRLLSRLRVGSIGDAVKRLQQRLGVTETGYFGPYTKKKLADYQREHNLLCDGVWSPQLEALLGWAVLNPPAPAAAAPAPTAPTPPIGVEQPPPAAQPPPAQQPEPQIAAAPVVAPIPVAVPPVAAPAAVPPAAVLPASVPPATPATTSAPITIAAAPQQSSAPGIQTRTPPPAQPTVATGTAATAQPPGRQAEPLPAPAIIKPATGLTITDDQLRTFAPRAAAPYRDTLLAGGDWLTKYGLDASPLRLCHFLAQLANESGRFTILEENLNYRTPARLRQNWPNRFATVAAAQPFVDNPQMLAEKVYGGRFDNRPGDGWRFRGRGLVQITGRANYREMGRRLNIPLEDQPELAIHPHHMLAIACETWAHRQLAGERDMNKLADINKLEAITYRLTGGYANLDDRREAFEEAWAIWADGKPPRRLLEEDVLDRGDRSSRVEELNARLRSLGMFEGITTTPPQHIFNQSTYRAVCRLQKSGALDSTGVVGAETWAVIERAIGRGPVTRAVAQPIARHRTRPRPRDRLSRNLRSLRAWSVSLAIVAILFVVGYLFALGHPDMKLASLWMPLLFSGVVFIAGLGIWLAARDEVIRPTDHASPTRSGPPQQVPKGAAAIGSFADGEEEPVRMGVNI